MVGLKSASGVSRDLKLVSALLLGGGFVLALVDYAQAQLRNVFLVVALVRFGSFMPNCAYFKFGSSSDIFQKIAGSLIEIILIFFHIGLFYSIFFKSIN